MQLRSNNYLLLRQTLSTPTNTRSTAKYNHYERRREFSDYFRLLDTEGTGVFKGDDLRQMLTSDAVAKMEHKKIIMKIINKAAAEGYAIPFRQRR
jgi:Ca2+-binding EF-hand superfamily protein